MIGDILLPHASLKRSGAYFRSGLERKTDAITANATYFGNAQWAQEYLDFCHRDAHFKSRWLAAAGDWTDKVVIDLGCGPGNIFATLGGKPRLLIGVDVAPGSLELAAKLGYTAVLADAAYTPFRSQVADIVAINASLHHCDDMAAVLREGARLVKPHGLLVTDHDPQLTAWDYKGLAKLMWDARLWVYRAIGHGFHKTGSQQSWGCGPRSITSRATGSRRNSSIRRWSRWASRCASTRTTTRSALMRCAAWWGRRNGNTGWATCCPAGGPRRLRARCR